MSGFSINTDFFQMLKCFIGYNFAYKKYFSRIVKQYYDSNIFTENYFHFQIARQKLLR